MEHSKSQEMTPFDILYMTSYLCNHSNYGSILHHFNAFDLENAATGRDSHFERNATNTDLFYEVDLTSNVDSHAHNSTHSSIHSYKQ